MSRSILPNGPPAVQSSPLPDTPKLAAVYARVSSDDQAKNFSVPSQVDACMKLAQQEGYTVLTSHVFRDEGISGTTLDRPALTRLRDLIATGSVAAVVVLDLDRLARKMGKLLVLMDEFHTTQVRMLCVTHPVGTGPEHTLLLQMRGAVAEYEREKLLERTRRGRQARATAGYYGGGNPPYGYRYIREPHKGCVEIEETEAAIVRWMFQAYLDGQHLRQLAWALQARGVPPPMVGRGYATSGTWQWTVLSRILKNTAYIGQAFWNKRECVTPTQARTRDQAEWIPLSMPAIIPQETFAAVQEKLVRNLALSPHNRKHPYLFVAGRLRCGRCGQGMSGYSSCGLQRYRCYSQVRHAPGEPFCRGSVRATDIEPLVWEKIARVLQDPHIIAAELERYTHTSEAGVGDAHREAAVIKKALAALDREAQRWDAAYAQEVIELPELQGKKHDIAERRKQLMAQHAEIEQALQQVQDDEEALRGLFHYCQQVQERLTTLDIAKQQLALEWLDMRVTWTPGAPVQIEGRVPLDITASSATRYG